jgi:hypothetical protein
MRKHIAKFALLTALAAAPWMEAHACDCRILDPDKAHQDSTHIILGEVIKVEAITTAPDGRGNIEYVATLKPVETYRGKPNVEVRVKFFVNPGVIGCGVSMKVGERYVILEKERDSLIYDGLCAERIRVAIHSVVEYMRTHP